MKLIIFIFFQDEYFAKYGGSVIPVEPNDVFFSLHAVVLTTVTIIQCFIFEVSYFFLLYAMGLFT